MFDAVFVPIRCQQSSWSCAAPAELTTGILAAWCFMFPTPAAARQSLSVTIVATNAAPGQADPSPHGFGAVCSHSAAANRWFWGQAVK